MKTASHNPHRSLLRFHYKKRLNLVMQAQASECGLACITMIANYFGNNVSIDKLRQLHPVSSQGSNLTQILQQGELLGMSSRAIKVSLAELKQLSTPCIIHWNFQHFVVLKKVGKRHCEIADPAVGMRKISMQDISSAFTGVAIEMQPNPAFQKTSVGQQLKLIDFLAGASGVKRSLFILFSLSVLLQLFAIAAPFYMQTVIDEVIVKTDTSLLTVLALAFGLLLLIDTLTTLLRERVMLHFSNRFSIHMATRVFSHLLSVPIDYFQKRHLGDVVSRFNSLQNIRQIVASGIISGLIDGLMAILMLAVLFLYSTELAAIVCLVVVLYGLTRCVFFQAMKRQNQEIIQSQAAENSHFMQSVRAIKTIKLNNKNLQRKTQWLNLLSSAMNKQIRLSTWQINFSIFNKLLFGLENILIVFLAATLVTQNLFSIGMLYAFMSYKSKFISSADNLINHWLEFKMLRVHLDRLADIVFTESERFASLENEININVEQLGASRTKTYHLCARNLTFQYHASQEYVFKGININIPKATTVAIIGPSGCGKSSLLLCLLGLVTASEGSIHINGSLLLAHNRHQQGFAAVLQDDQLLTGSIIDNITDFSEQTNLLLAVSMAKAACLHDDIMQMTMQYNTLIGDMGSTLSGGQKQRLLLARALYKQPSLLFLDEATSHLDASTETQINNNLCKLSMTKVVIAHRQETIASADIVLALSQGELRDVTHLHATPSMQQQASI